MLPRLERPAALPAKGAQQRVIAGVETPGLGALACLVELLADALEGIVCLENVFLFGEALDRRAGANWGHRQRRRRGDYLRSSRRNFPRDLFFLRLLGRNGD